jgi:hypothetical protein
MRLPFGKLQPDLPSMVNAQGLVKAVNMMPVAGGWRPMFRLANLDNVTPTNARPRGAISGLSAAGTGYLIAGDDTTLYRQTDTGFADVSRIPAYSLGQRDRWDFTQMGKNVFAVTRNDEMQYYELGASTTFDNVSTGAPRARHIEVVANKFLVAGNIYDKEYGPLPDAISWSGVAAPFSWPVPGSNEAVSVQSDRQRLEGQGGWVHDIVSGAEVGAVFREKSIHRMDYVGGDAIFNIREVEKRHGMLIPHSGVAYERKVFFIAEDGFRVFDYTSTVNVGKDRINRTFFADLDSENIDRVWTAKDPDETVIWIAYPGAGNVGGRPNRIMVWDYVLNAFGQAELELESLVEDTTDTGASLDAPESLPDDPNDLGDPGFEHVGGTPGYGQTSFDDRTSRAGSSRMGAFDTAFIPSDFTGDALEGLVETGDIELFPGRRGFLSSARPLVDDREARVSVGTKDTRSVKDEDIAWTPYVGQDRDGKCSIRRDARYHRLRVKLPAGWTNAIGVDIDGRESGTR